MNEMLKGVKADLTDRRMLPLVGLVVFALIAAIAYAALGGSSSSTPPAPSASTSLPIVPHGIAVSEAQSGDTEAVAETTDGTKAQRHGSSRDPFTVLSASVTGNKTASEASTAAATSTPSASSSSTPSTETKAPETSGGGSTTPAAAKPHKQSKPKTIYHVALQFGVVPAGATTETTELTPYTGLSKATPLPSPKERLIEFVGVTVTHGGKSASFAIDGELILKGSGTCLPSAAQCQVVDLPQGASEQMEYFSPSGALVNYELRIISITSSKASAADVKGVLHAQGLISHGLLGDGGALHEAGLHFSSLAGVLVFSPHKAKSARASVAIAR